MIRISFNTISCTVSRPFVTKDLSSPSKYHGNFYRPQTKVWGKVMFLHLSVILSTGVVFGSPLGRQTPPLGRHPTGDGHCRGRYASYWNAFLYHLKIGFNAFLWCCLDIVKKIKGAAHKNGDNEPLEWSRKIFPHHPI